MNLINDNLFDDVTCTHATSGRNPAEMLWGQIQREGYLQTLVSLPSFYPDYLAKYRSKEVT